jgi:peptide/nickel transport system substrate-binding protein
MCRFYHNYIRLKASGRQVRNWGLALLVMMIGLGLATASARAAADTPDKGGTVIWAVHESMPSFDLHYETTYVAAQPVAPIYNGLLTFDVYDNEKIIGELAERWEIADEGKRLTFFLRQGVKFHDGKAFTCADAKYSIDKLADPKRANRAFVAVLENIYEKATCENDSTLIVSLSQPSAAVLTMLAGAHAVMMQNGIAERLDRKDPEFLVGTGPFKYKSYTPGVDFQAERNPDYWKPGLPHIDAYRAVVISDLTKIFASFRARQLTMTGIGRHLERPEADILERSFPDAVVAIGPRAGWDSFVMNNSKPPFNDLRMRKAVALATDREKMIEIAAEGWGVIGGFIGPHTPYALSLGELKQYPQFGEDIEKRQAEAKKLVEEAGYGKGVNVDYVVRRGPLYERGALSRQDDLKKIGINVNITLLDTAGFRDRIEKGEFQGYTVLSAVQFDDPDLYYSRLVCDAPSNLAKYCNKEFDQLFKAQSQTLDTNKRAELTRKMEHILLKDMPDDRGFYWKSAMAYWNRLQKWPPIHGTTVYNYGRFEQVWCQDGRCM